MSNQPSGGSRNINKRPGHQINMCKKFRFGGVVVRDQFGVFAHDSTVITIFSGVQDADSLYLISMFDDDKAPGDFPIVSS